MTDGVKKAPQKKGKRGGARKGAGRKPKPGNSNAAANSNEKVQKKAKLAKTPLAPTDQTNRARRYAQLAIDTWADVALNADSAAARNQAAENLMTWGYGKPFGIGDATMRPVEKAAKAPKLGKKEQMAMAAKNPDTSTSMGELMAQRAAQAKLNS